MEKFFKITSYISINSTFDNDDDDDILKHGEGGSGGGGGGDAEVSANLLENWDGKTRQKKKHFFLHLYRNAKLLKQKQNKLGYRYRL